jgi:hypothetical protein
MANEEKTKQMKFRYAATAILATLFSLPAFADTTYTYTGNPMTYSGTGNANVCGGSECSITGSFTVASSLGDNFSGTVTPESYSFTDGNQNLSTGSIVNFFTASTDASGAINGWAIELEALGYGPWMVTESSGLDESYNGYLVYNYAPGTWTSEDPTATPEPSSLLLLSSGLVGLGFMKRKVFQS